LTCGVQDHRLTPKQAGVLEALLDARGGVVSREALLQRVWQGEPVSDELLSRAIADLRKRLDDDARRPRFIATVPRRGYRWVANPANPSSPSREARRPLGLASALAAASVVLLVAVLAGSGFEPAPPRPAWDWNSITSITHDAGHEVTPDIHAGRVVYAAEGPNGAFDLFLRDAAGRSPARQLTATTHSERSPVFSPDGTRVAFAVVDDGQCRVLVLTLDSGSLDAVAPCAGPLVGRTLAWSEDGIVHPGAVAGPGGAAIALFRTRPGLPPRQLTRPRAGEVDASPTDGSANALVFFRARWGDAGGRLMVADGDRERVLAELDGPVMAMTAYDETGQGLMALRREGQWGLWRYDVAGPLELVQSMPLRGLAQDDDGTLVISEIQLDYDIFEAPFASGAPAPLVGSTAHDTTPTPGPKGDRMAYVARRGERWKAWLAQADGTAVRSLPGTVRPGTRLAWHPEGHRLSYLAVVDGVEQLIEVDRNGMPVTRATLQRPVRHPAYRPDGTRLVACQAGEVWRICAVAGDGALEPLPGIEGIWPMAGSDAIYAYRPEDQGLYRHGAGGDSMRIATLGDAPGSDWSLQDDALVLLRCPAPGRASLWRIDLQTGAPSHLADYTGIDGAMQPAIDGPNDRLLFSRPRLSDSDLRVIRPRVGA
ncbi:MAG: winged helix-turn-helix domain-containing protein, partial [Pseudomonadota bacterium]